MATTKAREDIKADLKTLKEDLKTGAREETQRLREKAAEAEARLRAKGDEVRQQARGYYETARERGREYYDDAAERLDEAQRYVVERVQERPLQSTAIALGVGMLADVAQRFLDHADHLHLGGRGEPGFVGQVAGPEAIGPDTCTRF